VQELLKRPTDALVGQTSVAEFDFGKTDLGTLVTHKDGCPVTH
jgi:hypothetical protein